MEPSQHTQNYRKYCQAVDTYENYEWAIEGALLLAAGQLVGKLFTNLTATNAFLVSTGSFIALRIAHFPIDHHDNFLKKNLCEWGAFLVLGGVSYPFLAMFYPTLKKSVYNLGAGLLLAKTVSLVMANQVVRRHFDAPDIDDIDERARDPKLLDRFYSHFRINYNNDWKKRSFLFQIKFLTLWEEACSENSINGSFSLGVNSNGNELEESDIENLSQAEIEYLLYHVFDPVSTNVTTVNDYLKNISEGLHNIIPTLYDRALELNINMDSHKWFCKAVNEIEKE